MWYLTYMRISALADFHYPRLIDDFSWIDDQPWRDADVLVIAGDLVNSYRREDIIAVFRYFSSFPGAKLFCGGNHDLWTRKYDSEQIYREEIPGLAEASGFHYLDVSPRIVDGVGFVGNIGWYDYSFAPESFSLEEGVAICESEKKEGEPRFLNTGKRWEDLTSDDFEKKVLIWSENEKLFSLVWNDRSYINWRYRDREFLAQCLERLEEDLEKVSREVDVIVAVTHHTPFEALLEPPETLARAYGRAFLGSRKIGALLLEYPKVKLCLSGHTHYQKQISAGPIEAVTVRNTFQKEII